MAANTSSPIHFFFESKTSLEHRTQLKSFIESIFKKEKRKLESLNYIFVSDEKLLEINQQFLSHDFYTDIITFDYQQKPLPVMGEIYISIDRVRDNAITNGQTFKRELHRVIFHGALHLCGYKDKSPKEEKLMRQKEDGCLASYFGS